MAAIVEVVSSGVTSHPNADVTASNTAHTGSNLAPTRVIGPAIPVADIRDVASVEIDQRPTGLRWHHRYG